MTTSANSPFCAECLLDEGRFWRDPRWIAVLFEAGTEPHIRPAPARVGGARVVATTDVHIGWILIRDIEDSSRQGGISIRVQKPGEFQAVLQVNSGEGVDAVGDRGRAAVPVVSV